MILCIIQARMSSNRLPGKVLKDLAGKPMLQWVIDAAKDSKLIDGVVVATSTMASDLPIATYCYENGTYHLRGSLDDVLERFYMVAKEMKPTHIVRLTADCPLLTGDIIDEVIRRYLINDLQYILNTVDGLDVEVFPYAELLRAHKLATETGDREHVTPFIQKYVLLKNEVAFVRTGIKPFSVNTQEEFDKMESILSGLQVSMV